MSKIGLVLEGGAMRGIYTAGVLDFFLKKNIEVDYISAVSAGACQAFSYISKQIGRNKKTTLTYINDHRYLSYKNLIKYGSIFGFDFMFGEVCKSLVPFDYDTFESSNTEFAIGATNCITGEAEYFYKSQCDTEKMFEVCKASSSMPLISNEVIIDGKAFLDGGISESIPIMRALADGCDKTIIILTRNLGYRKIPSRGSLKVSKGVYKNYKGLLRALENRYKVYNKTIEYIEKLEKEGKVFIIRPSMPIVVGRMEKNKNKLFNFYKEGYFDAEKSFEGLLKFIKNN